MKFAFASISAFVFLVAFSGCTSFPPPQKDEPVVSVREVNCTAVPELQEWADRAERLGNDLYPKLVAMLTDGPDDAPRQFNIIFRRTLPNDNRGVAGNKTIWISSRYFATNVSDSYQANPENFDKVLIHEMAHVATGKGLRSYTKKSPGYWVEGIADYGRFKLGYTNGWSCPECDLYPHYKSGYSCAGAFLLFVDANCGSNTIRNLATQLRRGTYSDQFFADATGHRLDTLWNQFKQTAAFRPGAEESYEVHEALGYVNGLPPKNLKKRVVAYLEKKPGGVLTLDAARFLRAQFNENKLPGVTEAERNGRHFGLNMDPMDLLYGRNSTNFLARRKLCGRFDKETNRLNYVVIRPSQNDPWRLEKAWRADDRGTVLEEFKIE